MEEKQDSIKNISENNIKKEEPGRGTLILILGIFSVILLGPFLGIPAWIMGNKDLKKIKRGIISIREQGLTQAGMVLGIIGTFFSAFFIIFGIAVVVGINIFSASVKEANRDALISNCTTIAAMAQQYYRKPNSLGGGGGSFIGFEIPKTLNETSNGKFTIESFDSKSLSVTGIGKVKGNDSSNPVMVIMKVFPDRIEMPYVLN